MAATKQPAKTATKTAPKKDDAPKHRAEDEARKDTIRKPEDRERWPSPSLKDLSDDQAKIEAAIRKAESKK